MATSRFAKTYTASLISVRLLFVPKHQILFYVLGMLRCIRNCHFLNDKELIISQGGGHRNIVFNVQELYYYNMNKLL